MIFRACLALGVLSYFYSWNGVLLLFVFGSTRLLILFCVHVGLQLAPIPNFGSDEVTQKLPIDTNIIFEFYIGLSIVVGTAVTNCLHRSLGIWLIRHDVFVSTRVNHSFFGGRHYVVMQLDLLRAKMCPFIHPVELSTRARRCRPRQGCIPGRVGYQDTRLF